MNESELTERLVGDLNPFTIPHTVVGGYSDHVADGYLKWRLHLSRANLGALDVTKHRDLMAVLLAEAADLVECLLVRFVGAVTKVEPADVHPGQNHFLENFLRRRRRAKSANYLGIPCRGLGGECAGRQRGQSGDEGVRRSAKSRA